MQIHPWVRRILLILGAVTLVSIILAIIVSLSIFWYGRKQIKLFEAEAGRSVGEIMTEVKRGLSREPILQDGRKNLLLLGGDSVAGRDVNQGILTDTILMVSFEVETGKVALLSIPRDLWIPEYKTKINALYYYGERRAQQAELEDPEINDEELDSIRLALLHEALEKISGLEVHHTIFLSLDAVEELVDSLGGVEVTVERGFVDERFPRPGVDVTTETDPEILYQTVEFEPGKQTMSSEQVSQFLRSRNSEDLEEGTDLARASRQQRVLSAVGERLAHPDTLFNPVILGKMFAFYADRYESALTISEMTALLQVFADQEPTPEISIRSIEIPVATDSSAGLIFNPPIGRYGLWVFEARDPSFAQLRNYIQLELEEGDRVDE